jgi:NADPH-dependent 2,4-dienoyl-CoA reductase/sulfur reductase-like enzyme/peroxiredoxin family protein/TusA-related sulfurtransferase/rhodanese-related sulfurtransferase
MHICVVGGVAGGASFAARMRRLDEDARITIFERGNYISFANCGMPYHIGDTIQQRDKLIIQTPESFGARYNVDVRLQHTVTAVSPAKKTITVVHGGRENTQRYDRLLLSPGSTPVRPPIEGIESSRIMTLRTIDDMDAIRARIDSGSVSRVVVVGGGFIGLEMAENLRHRGLSVSLVEAAPQIFLPADKEMANVLMRDMMINGIALHVDNAVSRFEERDDDVQVGLKDGTRLEADMVILAIGVKPDTAFLEDTGIARNEQGAIVVDEHMRTNQPDIYAVGDAVEVTDFVSGKKVHVPLAGPANRQGRIAADNIAGITSTYAHTQGTSICKVFDLSIAATGISEKNAAACGIAVAKAYVHAPNHASYYPGAYPMSLKLLYSPEDRRVLGAQIVGKEGIDKRIDVLATAVRHHLTVDDLAELELAYAPPHGNAKDPVNMSGFVAQNILDGRMPVAYAEECIDTGSMDATLLDVRTREEHEQGAIPGSICIPIDELRSRLNELDKEREILVYCQVGLRGYQATRILLQKGFAARNLTGGYKTYSAFVSTDMDSTYLSPSSASSCSAPSEDTSISPQKVVDATGLQCPGPIMQLKKGLDEIPTGAQLEIRATDQGFAMDIPAWCGRTGNRLVSLTTDDGVYRAVIQKGGHETAACPASGNETGTKKKTMVVFSNDMDKMMAAFIIANGAASMGSEVTLFFTFWGLNLLRRDNGGGTGMHKSFLEKMFGAMMPRGPRKTVLSKMHMAGMGTKLMHHVMKKKNVYSLEQLMQQARESGIRFVACAMSMDIMGIKKEELIDGVEFGGVSYYLSEADNADYNLFI